MWVCVQKCRYLWRPETLNSSGAGVIGNCKLMDSISGNQAWVPVHDSSLSSRRNIFNFVSFSMWNAFVLILSHSL